MTKFGYGFSLVFWWNVWFVAHGSRSSAPWLAFDWTFCGPEVCMCAGLQSNVAEVMRYLNKKYIHNKKNRNEKIHNSQMATSCKWIYRINISGTFFNLLLGIKMFPLNWKKNFPKKKGRQSKIIIIPRETWTK